jgi:hypothetical protein
MERIWCSHAVDNPYGCCQRKAVVKINGHYWCKAHGLKVLPAIDIVPGTENLKVLKSHIIRSMHLD